MKIDYLAITGSDSLWQFFSSLLDGWTPARALYGYDEAWSCELAGVTVMRSDRVDMGVHVRLSGQGCDNLRDKLIDILKLGRASRIDLAYDTHHFEPDEVLAYAKSGLVRSISSNYRRIESNTGESPVTVYLGSRSSEKMLRCYKKGGATRMEWEVKGCLARAVQKNILNGQSLASIFTGLGKFLEKKGVNSHCDIVLSKWQEIAKSCASVVTVVTKTIEKTRAWLLKAVSASLVTVMEDDLDFLSELIIKGKSKNERNYQCNQLPTLKLHT